MLYPNLEDVKKYLESYKTVPVFYELLMDSCTPIQLFNCLHELYEDCFILESVDNKDKWGRYSYVGIDPKAEYELRNGVMTIKQAGKAPVEVNTDDPIGFLSKVIEEHKSPRFESYPKLTGGLMGYFAYDMVRYFEKKLTNIPKDDLGMADADLFMFEKLVAYDHLSNKAVIILNINSTDDIDAKYAACEQTALDIVVALKSYQPEVKKRKPMPDDIEVRSNISKEQYLENVRKAKEYIKDGDIFQIVPSQRFEMDNPPDSFDVYRMLRSTNPSPYLFYFKQRGATHDEDIMNEQRLINDPKERAEHTMLVDLGRNDIGKVSEFGSVEVTDLMVVERYSKVMHIVSNVKGKLREDKKPLDALMAVLPAGTLSGAPKVRAMEIIDEMETTKRCLYGGTVGYLAFDGSLDTCIAIRTVLFKNNKAYVQAGGGVVADSVPENEYEESCNKALAVINAVKEAARL